MAPLWFLAPLLFMLSGFVIDAASGFRLFPDWLIAVWTGVSLLGVVVVYALLVSA